MTCYDRRSVGQFVLVSSTHLGHKTRFLLLSDNCGFVDVERSLWLKDGSVVYTCCWPSPAQSFSGSSPSGLLIIFHCLRFETPPTWRAKSPYLCPQEQGDSVIPTGTRFFLIASYYSQGYGGGIRTLLHGGSHLLSKYSRQPSLYSFGTDRMEDTVSSSSLLLLDV
jgi:hypothetical protein